MTIKRLMQMILGGAGWLFFFLPMVSVGIFNIGTVAGLLLFGGLFLWGLFRPRIVDRLRALRQKRLWRVTTSALCLLFCAGLLLCAVESALMVVGVFSSI